MQVKFGNFSTFLVISVCFGDEVSGVLLLRSWMKDSSSSLASGRLTSELEFCFLLTIRRNNNFPR